MPTALTAAGRTGASSPPAASPCSLPHQARPTAAAWASGVGWWSAPSAWLHQFKRLRTRYERRADLHQAFLTLGCCVICARML